jgi:phage terminase Nu1 subunit (DNA packaging protein)
MPILEDYLDENELAAELKKSVRLLQQWRQRRIGPPWTRLGGQQVIYRKAAVTDWLRKLEQQPVRNRRTA